MPTKYLVDSSFLYATYNKQDRNHYNASTFLNSSSEHLIFPEIILGEVTFLFHRGGGIPASVAFLQVFVDVEPILQNITPQDLIRSGQIMQHYSSARFDFVDCCIMALSERLNITKICTFDRRDFSIFRPKHCN